MNRETRRAIIDRARVDPGWFATHVLRTSPTDYQMAILRSIVNNRHTRVRSSHAVGKSSVAAMAACWWLPTSPPSDVPGSKQKQVLAKVITTAPTDRQVRMILWGEIGRLFRQSAIRLSERPPDTQKWVIGGAEWQAEGFTAPANDPDRFQGHHSPHMLVIVDEACGISKQIYNEGVWACLTESPSRLLSIGNPTNQQTEFAASFVGAGETKGEFKISAFDTPNFTEFGITLEDIRTGAWEDKIAGRPLPRPYLVNPSWVRERWERWGEDSPLFMGRVLAEWPPSSLDALVSLQWVTDAAERFRSASWPTDPIDPHILGVDVARTGNDSTKIYERKGTWCRKVMEVHGADTMVVVGHIIRAQKETKAERAHIDEIGIGAGVVDRLTEQGYRWAIGVNNGGKADDEESFKNIRAESYWGVRKALELGELKIDSEDFAQDITSIRWEPTSTGKTQIEAKEHVKSRLGRSPDDADAVALTYAKARRIVII